MNIIKTTLYKHALESDHIFPEGVYLLGQIYETILKYVYMPADHFEDRPDVSYPFSEKLYSQYSREY